MNIVITVDDLGLHPAVGRAVESLADRGVVASASLLANGMDVEAAARLSCVDVGVHLDILRGRPVSHWQEVNSLVDENGVFLGKPEKLFHRFTMGKLDHSQIEREWAAQIERVIDMGVAPTHLSSHADVMAWPSLIRMAGDLARRYGIKWLRKPQECAEIARLETAGSQSKFHNVCTVFGRETAGVAWTDILWGVNDTGKDLSPANFARHIRRLGNLLDTTSSVEIMCRPGLPASGDPVVPSGYGAKRLSTIWRAEYASLSESDWPQVLSDLSLDLMGFGSLPADVE